MTSKKKQMKAPNFRFFSVTLPCPLLTPSAAWFLSQFPVLSENCLRSACNDIDGVMVTSVTGEQVATCASRAMGVTNLNCVQLLWQHLWSDTRMWSWDGITVCGEAIELSLQMTDEIELHWSSWVLLMPFVPFPQHQLLPTWQPSVKLWIHLSWWW